MAYPNFIRDTNRFQLAGPPQWFLSRLWAFDDSLVIVPSRQGFYYRLGQRRPMRLEIAIINDVMKEQADTQMLANYKLVPVTTILATVNWDNPAIFTELQRMAPWRMGGAEAFSKRLESQEQAERQRQAEEQDFELTDRAKEGWRYYNKKIGTRSHIFDVKGAKKQTNPSNIITPIVQPKPYKPLITTTWA